MTSPLTKGLAVKRGVLDFEFRPSLIIMAGQVNKLGLDIRSFREPLRRAIKQVMIPSIHENFQVGGRPPWEEWTEETIARREYDGYGGGDILVRTGALKRTMGFINIWTITQEEAYIADLPAQVWYGKVHQAGVVGSSKFSGDTEALDAALRLAIRTGQAISGGGTATIPERPFAVIQPEDGPRIRAVFDEWLGERLAAAGFPTVG